MHPASGAGAVEGQLRAGMQHAFEGLHQEIDQGDRVGCGEAGLAALEQRIAGRGLVGAPDDVGQ